MQFADRTKEIKSSPTLALNALTKKMQAEGINVINFTCGEPDFDTPEHIKQAAVLALSEGFTKYTAVSGITELKDAIIRSLKRDSGLSYAREEVIATPGAKYAIYAALQSILNPGDEVLIPAPYWVSYPDQTILMDSRPVILKTTDKDNFKITPDRLERAINKKSRLLIINSPSNPSGMAYTEDELKNIAKVCIKHNLWVLSDEIYDRILFDGFKPKSIASIEGMKTRTVVINGVSKTYAMTGWRMGFAAGPRELITIMEMIQGQAVSNVNSITQKAAIAAYDGPQDAVDKMVIAYKQRRDYVLGRVNTLGSLSSLTPNGTFYVFPNVSAIFGRTLGGKKIGSAAGLSEFLLNNAHVSVVPGEAFGSDEHIRLSYATSLEKIKEGMDRIENVLRNHSS